VDGGLYTADLEYRADGNVVGLATQPNLTLDFALDANGWPAFSTHTWDPTGTKVAYTDGAAASLWVANLAMGPQTQIKTGNCAYPDWSPDGTKIVAGSGTVFTIKPDGSGVKSILTPRYVNNVYVYGFFRAYFSPTGSHVTCGGDIHLAGGGADNDVFRATSSGGTVTNLTNSPTLVESPVAWR
jgi:Tol biopolymer transport system component